MNETHTLNGKRYAYKLVEIDGGCTRCELGRTVGSQDYGITIIGDTMKTVIDDKYLSVQVSFCPFCGVAL